MPERGTLNYGKDGPWKVKAMQAIHQLVAEGKEFTTEDVVAIVGPPASFNALGGLFNTAKIQGTIVECGSYRNAKRHLVLKWRGKWAHVSSEEPHQNGNVQERIEERHDTPAEDPGNAV